MANQKSAPTPAAPPTTASPELHKYHIVLGNGDERDLSAAGIRTDGGILELLNNERDVVVAYGPGQWTMVEREARDDRG